MSFAFLRKPTVLALEPLAEQRGVSTVARSARGFLPEFKRYGSKGLDPWWKNRRDNFIKRHMAQVAMRKESLWKKDGSPSNRHLALAMWAYSPQPKRLSKWLKTRRNPELPEGTITPAFARFLGRHLDVDWDEVPFEEFRRGLEVEWEHADTVDRDWPTVGRIALDHLDEDERYYEKLDEAFDHESPRENPVATARHKFPIRDKTRLPKRSGGLDRTRIIDDANAASVQYVGMVVNPKTMRPYMVVRVSHNPGLRLVVPDSRVHETRYSNQVADLEVVGKAYFEEGDGDYAIPAQVTGMPRIHTPSGIPSSEQGTGLGTALYTAGALLAVWAEAFGEIRVPGIGERDSDNQGVSSGPGASWQAQAWWDAASYRGLTEEVELDETWSGERVEDEERVSFTLSVSVDPSLAIEQSGIMDQIYNEPFEGDWFHDALGQAASENGINEIESWDMYGAEVQDSQEIPVKFTATVTYQVKITDEEGNETEEDVEVEIKHTESFDLEELCNDGDTLIEAFLEDDIDDEAILSDAMEDASNVDVIERVITIDSYEPANNRYVDYEVEYEVDVRGYRQSTEIDETIYIYPCENAADKGLILDVTKSLYSSRINKDSETEDETDIFDRIPGAIVYGKDVAESWSKTSKRRNLEIILGLDLGEVEDPKIFDYFFKLAADLGASRSELQRFQNSVLAYRSDVPVELDIALHDADLHTPLSESGFRVNPDDEDYEEIGWKLFGPLSELD